MRFSFLTGCMLLLSVSATQAAGETDQLLQDRLRSHIEFLADDLLRGRQPGGDGYNIAANYVAGQFLQMGLLPAGTDGHYFQQVPLRQAFLQPGSAQMVIVSGAVTTPLVFGKQFFMRPSVSRRASDLSAKAVFVGYGIDAPELDYNDYVNVDVKGKVVVFLAGQPEGFPSEEGAHFSSGKEKARAAARHGAVGIIAIHTPRAARRYPWGRLKSRVGMPSMGWIDSQGKVHGEFEQIQASAMLRHTAAQRLFKNAPLDMATLIVKDENAEALPAFALESEVTLRQSSTHQALYSPNVVAVLPGSDPVLAQEYVVYTAHLDHIGQLHSNGANTGQVDSINNGALDNAAGVAVMLETARLFSQAEAPRRSILFVAVTAEEKGLVGSEYFAMNPTVPLRSMVSEINLDMPLLLYDFGDIIAYGAEHSSLGRTVREVVQEFGIELTPDPFPEQNIFVRSDHYRFVQQGIPSIFLVTGFNSLDNHENARVIFENFLQQRYHKPGDDLSLPIHYGAAARFTRINARIGEKLADEPRRPNWYEGDFFGRIYVK